MITWRLILFVCSCGCWFLQVSSSSMEVGVVPDGNTMSEISNCSYSKVAAVTVTAQFSAADREARVLRYREKRKNRKFEKTIRYASRKAYAETRPRIKGRFAKRSDADPLSGYGVVPSCWFRFIIYIMYDATATYFLSSYVCFAVYILRSFLFELSNVKLQTVDRFCSLLVVFWDLLLMWEGEKRNDDGNCTSFSAVAAVQSFSNQILENHWWWTCD